MLSEKEKLNKLTNLGIELNQIRDLDILMERVLKDARIVEIFFSRLNILRAIQERYKG